MAMLAEPRQRKSYILQPRGKALYEDDCRFGTKMLKKMGWSKDKGLGANENGAMDFIRVQYKHDLKGLAYEARDDQWTQHESGFSDLLQTLNSEEVNDQDDCVEARAGFGCHKVEKKVKKMKAQISGESLEEKSKSSKARVHYKKFTRGKDLSRYSEKDLANIFGRKSNDESKDFYSSLTFASEQKDETKEEEEEDKEESSMLVTSGLSLNDYFKQKMEAMRNKKNKVSVSPPEEDTKITLQSAEEEESLLSMTKKSHKRKNAVKEMEEEKIQLHIEEPSAISVKKKTKKTKRKTDQVQEISESVEQESKNNTRKKSRKEKKTETEKTSEVETQSDVLPSIWQTEEEALNKVMKKEKNKNKAIKEAEFQQFQKQKKRKENEMPIIDNPQIQFDTVILVSNEQQPQPVDKKKKTLRDEKRSDEITAVTVPAEIAAELHTPAELDTVQTLIQLEQNSRNFARSDEQDVSLEELEKQLDTYNDYIMSCFCAEKFRNVDMNGFKGATMADINGYDFDAKKQIKIMPIEGDEKRITDLWMCATTKYLTSEQEPKYTYHKYCKQFRKARQSKSKRMPRFHTKAFKRMKRFTVL